MDTKLIIKEANIATVDKIEVRGVQGPRGAIGYQGPQGVQGSQGVQGERGSQGALGANGINGLDAVICSRYSVINSSTVFSSERILAGEQYLNRILLIESTEEITLEFPYPYRNKTYLESFFIIANNSNFNVKCIAYNDNEELGITPSPVQLDFIVAPNKYRMLLFNFSDLEPNNYFYQQSLNRWRLLF